jgi:hypothetical protein
MNCPCCLRKLYYNIDTETWEHIIFQKVDKLKGSCNYKLKREYGETS